MEFLNNAKSKFEVWNQERKEKAANRRAADAEPANVTIPLSLVRSAKLAAWMAYFSLVYFLWLYTLDIARDRAASLHLTHVGGWIGDIQFYFPYIVGFAIVAIGIPYVAKIAIPTFMSLSWRGNFWPKLWALFIAMAVSLVVIAGTFTVQGDTIMERDRDAAVAVEQVQIANATLAARIADVQHAMDERTQSPSQYVRTAASMSPASYDRFVAARVGDPQYQRLLSYRAVAEEMVTLNEQMSTLRQQQAQSTAVASVQGEVTTERTSWIADTLGWLEGVRAILLSLVMDIVCLIMPWIALRLEQARNRQMGVEASGWADEAHRIEDLREQEPIARNPATMQTVMEEENLETGEKKRMIKPKPYWRTVKKGKKERIEVPPEMLPDEEGVYTDGGKRTAVTIGGLMEVESGPVEDAPVEHDAEATHSVVAPTADAEAPAAEMEIHPEPSDPILSQQEQADIDEALAAESEAPLPAEGEPDQPENLAEQVADEPTDEEQGDVVAQDEPREPETNPSRLLAAE